MTTTLGHTWASLAAAIGGYLGYGTDPKSFSKAQMADVELALDGGYRRYCYPPNYTWSWLLTTRNVVTTKTDIAEYPIPNEIGNVSGALTISTTSTNYAPLKLYHEGVVRQLRSASPSMSGRPSRAAVYNGQPVPGFETGKRILFYPTPDGTYTIMGRCQLNPLPLRKELQEPLGGPAFAQMLLEACLAEAERQKDDLAGIHAQAFQEQLAAGLEQDKRLRSEFMGQMLDPNSPEATAFMTGGGGAYGLSNNFRVDFNGVYY